MDLYYSPESAPSRAVIMTAKALDVELRKINLDIQERQHMKPKFLKINPQHCLPTISDHGFVLWESRAIMIYLSDKYGKTDALYPKCPQKRAVINQHLYFDKAIMFKNFTINFYQQFCYGGSRGSDPWCLNKIHEGFADLNTILKGKQYVTGDSLSLADISLAATVSSFEAGCFDFSRHTNVVEWYANAPFTIPGWAENEIDCALLRETLKGVVKLEY